MVSTRSQVRRGQATLAAYNDDIDKVGTSRVNTERRTQDGPAARGRPQGRGVAPTRRGRARPRGAQPAPRTEEAAAEQDPGKKTEQVADPVPEAEKSRPDENLQHTSGYDFPPEASVPAPEALIAPSSEVERLKSPIEPNTESGSQGQNKSPDRSARKRPNPDEERNDGNAKKKRTKITTTVSQEELKQAEDKKAAQEKATQEKAQQEKAQQEKAQQDKAQQEKAQQGKAALEKAAQEKAAQQEAQDTAARSHSTAQKRPREEEPNVSERGQPPAKKVAVEPEKSTQQPPRLKLQLSKHKPSEEDNPSKDVERLARELPPIPRVARPVATNQSTKLSRSQQRQLEREKTAKTYLENQKPKPAPETQFTETVIQGARMKRKKNSSAASRAPNTQPRSWCQRLNDSITRMEAREAAEGTAGIKFPAEDTEYMDDDNTTRAMAAVTEAIAAANPNGPRFSILSGTGLQIEAAEDAANYLIARPGNEAFISRVSGNHISLFHLRRTQDNRFGFRHLDSSPAIHRGRYENLVGHANAIARSLQITEWHGGGDLIVDTENIEIVETPQQATNWTCGLHTIINAWAIALGLDVLTDRDKEKWGGPFQTMAVRMVNWALGGVLDMQAIEEFLKCFQIVAEDAVIPANRRFDRVQAFLRQDDLLEHMVRVRISDELNRRRVADPQIPTLDGFLQALELADTRLTGANITVLFDQYRERHPFSAPPPPGGMVGSDPSPSAAQLGLSPESEAIAMAAARSMEDAENSHRPTSNVGSPERADQMTTPNRREPLRSGEGDTTELINRTLPEVTDPDAGTRYSMLSSVKYTGLTPPSAESDDFTKPDLESTQLLETAGTEEHENQNRSGPDNDQRHSGTQGQDDAPGEDVNQRPQGDEPGENREQTDEQQGSDLPGGEKSFYDKVQQGSPQIFFDAQEIMENVKFSSTSESDSSSSGSSGDKSEPSKKSEKSEKLEKSKKSAESRKLKKLKKLKKSEKSKKTTEATKETTEPSNPELPTSPSYAPDSPTTLSSPAKRPLERAQRNIEIDENYDDDEGQNPSEDKPASGENREPGVDEQGSNTGEIIMTETSTGLNSSEPSARGFDMLTRPFNPSRPS